MSDVADAADVEAEIAATGEGEEAPKGGKKKLIMIGAAAFLLLAGGAGAAYFLGLFGGKESMSPDAKTLAQVYFYPLPEMTVNLASTGGRAQFLRVRVSLEMGDRAILKALPPVEPRIMDAFQVHLRELRAGDLEGSMGIYRLKEELLRRVNVALHPFKVDRVLFNEMLIQ